MNRIVFFIAMILMTAGLVLNGQTITDPDKKTDWWGDIDGFLNQQAKITLNLADIALRENPPAPEENLARKMALTMIDNVLHEEKAQHRPAVQQFYHNRIDSTINEIRSREVNSGAVIWKLYNHTFIIKTPSVTIGFDIQRGIPGNKNFTFSTEMMDRLISLVDVLFISHYHNDHADDWVAGRFIEQNKPVVTPPGLWEKLPVYSKIIHPERTADRIQEIKLPVRQITLKTVICPGHQGADILNNVYLVYSPEGMCFAHTGDQSYDQDLEWIDKIVDKYKIDVLMINSWSYYPEHRLARGFRPRLIIPGHENELNHSIDHREPYWLNYARLGSDPAFPWIQMAPGENYHYYSGMQ